MASSYLSSVTSVSQLFKKEIQQIEINLEAKTISNGNIVLDLHSSSASQLKAVMKKYEFWLTRTYVFMYVYIHMHVIIYHFNIDTS